MRIFPSRNGAPAFDLYLFAGPDPRAVLAAYTALTGRTPLPPRWALGYHQSRYSYATEAEARQVVARLRADAIPCDALWLDIDYQRHNAPFTVDPVAFPDLPGMVAGFAQADVQTVLITDPHIAAQPGDPSYDAGVAADAFIHAPGGGLYEAPVWPGQSVFPDFTLARARAYWGGLYRGFVAGGVAGFWNDMNEPAIFNAAKTMPDDTPHRLGPTSADAACPDAELVVAWMELGALQPFFRNHSMKGSCRREPWIYGDALEGRMRAAVERRYRLLPYLYTAFEEASRDGMPVLRPLWLEHPADPTVATTENAYLLGHDLLVAPRLERDATTVTTVDLPAGTWWDLATGTTVAGGAAVAIPGSADDSIHLFARAGAIIPQQPVTQAAGMTPSGALRLDVWPGSDCAGSLYLDDGTTYAYQKGALRRVAYTCSLRAAGLDVAATSNGDYPTWWSSTDLVLHGLPAAPASVTLDDAAVASEYDAGSGSLRVMIPGDLSHFRVSASW